MAKKNREVEDKDNRAEAIEGITFLNPIQAFAIGRYLDGVTKFNGAIATLNRVKRKLGFDPSIDELERIVEINISAALAKRRDIYRERYAS